MSDSLAISQSYAVTEAASTRQALQTEFVRQQAQAEQTAVDLLQQSAEQQKATLPSGQGDNVDLFA